jgi:DNA polymerase-3 subunit gamma/tau
VLSRCQRFDLRRIDADKLVQHLSSIAEREAITVEKDALALIARAAEGSVRDALSLLDQAIAHADGAVTAAGVRGMLGLADRARIVELFEALMRGDVAAALGELRAQYEIGADPAIVLADLAEFCHFVTRVKVTPAVADDISLVEAERTRGRALGTSLSMRVLARTWQMLLKGMTEVQSAARPIAAAEMVLVRIAYAADLPTPDEALRSLGGNGDAAFGGPLGNGGGGAASSARPASASRSSPPRGAPRAAVAPQIEPPAAAPARAVSSFEAVIALAAEKRDLQMKTALERDVRLVACEDGKLEIALEPGAAKTLVNDLARKLSQWTGRRWMVIVSGEPGQPTVKSQLAERQAALEVGVRADPLVRAVLERFPGAAIVGVRSPGEMSAPPVGVADDDPPPSGGDMPPDDDGMGDNWERDD